jgi:hypothetical protein
LVTIGLQFGGLPAMPCGHFCGGCLQWGGFPIMPRGHFSGGGRLQFGGVPTMPFGHSTLRQLGHLPAVPWGHFFGSSTLRQCGHFPTVPWGHFFGSSTLRQLGHVPIVPSGHRRSGREHRSPSHCVRGGQHRPGTLVGVQPARHLGSSTSRQFGHLPLVPSGHTGFSGSPQRLPVHTRPTGQQWPLLSDWPCGQAGGGGTIVGPRPQRSPTHWKPGGHCWDAGSGSPQPGRGIAREAES